MLRPGPRLLLVGVVAIAALFVFATLATPIALSWTNTKDPSPMRLLGTSERHHTSTCVDIGNHSDTCTFVQTTCHGFVGVFLRFYYCTSLWKPVAVAILCGLLLFLFGAVSVVAADFFCPNLQTISSKLQLSESMAGVTILAFGNGSPDLFSTFSAMDTGAGSLAVGELIGAAFFIVAIVSGTMGIIRPFQSKRITFMRDATFLTGAIVIITWIIYHQRIYWYHGVTLVVYYLIYVSVVVLGNFGFQESSKHSQSEQKSMTEEFESETTRLLGSHGRQRKPPRLSIPIQGFTGDGLPSTEYEPHLGHIIRPLSARSPSRLSIKMDISDMQSRSTSTFGSFASRCQRRALTPRVGIRTSLFGAIEFQEQLNALRRARSSHAIHRSPRQRQISMPHWKRQSSHTSIPCGRAAGGVGRRRASTMTDKVPEPRITQAPVSPESTNRSTGVAEDYFTYLSAHQPESHPVHFLAMKTEPLSVFSDHSAFMIPEIRLAPPNHNDTADDTPSHYYSPVSPLPVSHSREKSTSLHIMPWSPSFMTDDEVFISARQSLDISPSPSIHHHHQYQQQPQPQHLQHPYLSSLSIAMPQPDIHPPQRQHLLQNPLYAPFSIYPSPWQVFADTLIQTLFPTLRDWQDKTIFGQMNALAAIPLVFVFTLTLPVAEPDSIKVDGIEIVNDDDDNVDDDNDDGLVSPLMNKSYLSVQGLENQTRMINEPLMDMDQTDEVQQPWCRWLLVVQAVFSFTFLSIIMAVNGFIEPLSVGYGFAVGCLLAAIVYLSTNADKPPTWFWMLSFAGFFVALNWIFLLANEMVGLLKALGMIFNISEAIMGLTVFALGNSIGDLVANTAIAKMGLPTMAISACYAGPLLNSVLGVGIASVYQTLKTGTPYELDIAPTILVSSAGLITVLLSTLIVVNLNGYRINERLGFWMIFVYVTCCVINVSLEYMSTFHE